MLPAGNTGAGQCVVRRMNRLVFLAAGLATLAGLPSRCAAQALVERSLYSLTLEAFGNLTAGLDLGDDAAWAAGEQDVRLDGAVRWIGLVKGKHGLSFGPRLVVQTSPEDKLGLAERSLLVLAPWGRFEVGYRQGLPDVLLGYAPNNFTFTGAEYGPATGPGLDPDGRLPTVFLGRGLAAEIDRLSSLGFATTLYADQSAKVILVPSKRGGFQGGVSFAPDLEARSGPFERLIQTGLTYERYTENNGFRGGVSYTRARGTQVGNGVSTGDLRSLSGGASTVLHERLILAASFTYDGSTGLSRRPGASFSSRTFGWSASANYNVGPWTAGGYYQAAEGEGDTSAKGKDRLRVVQLGASYRFHPRVRLYASGYVYRFRNEGGRLEADRKQGAVVLVGARLAL